MKTLQKYIYIVAIATAGMASLSCDDYLDEIPDNRMQIDSPEKIKSLLVSSYPTANYATVCELRADNFVDNKAPDASGTYHNVNAYDRMDNALFAWEDVKDTDISVDTPFHLWENFYNAIAAANHALQAIEELKATKETADMNPIKGEALILRAYAHFILVNLFAHAYKDDEASKNDPGIAYVTEPATDINIRYERKSVAEVYRLIEKDIEEGLPLVTDEYEVPTYHFTKAAANAFAAKFYLYKRDYPKTIACANAVLGAGDPSSKLRDWTKTLNNVEEMANDYISPKSPANLLIIATYSAYSRRFIKYRYGCKGDAWRGSFNDSGPTWSGRVYHLDGRVYTYGENYGSFLPRTKEYFEYIDKVQGIGNTHVVRTEFTTDATLLDRAEAKVFTNDIEGAVADLQYWNKSHKMTQTLTKETITRFYTAGRKSFVFDFHNRELSPQFIVTPEQKPYIDCVLHFRRIEKILEGERWFDIKRYGIELEHIIGPTAERRLLKHDDPQRALQIPSDVINAGVVPNPRPTTTSDPSIKPEKVLFPN